MTSFGWKRKAPDKIEVAQKAFQPQEQPDEKEDPDFDWVAVNKKKRFEPLEDNKARFERLKQEGISLAEEEKFWQAIKRWDEALAACGSDAPVLEMKAQALINLHEWESAVEAAVSAVKARRNWWAAHQTLGRAHLGLGNLGQARREFQTALHLNPQDEELRKEDLAWVVGLLKHQDRAEELGRVEQEEGEETLLVRNRLRPEDLHL